jgi:lipoic acid synthetase
MKERDSVSIHGSRPRLPPWMKRQKRDGKQVLAMKKILREKNLHSVCQSAGCPNICECFDKPTATFMVLGDHCTRHCRFCGVSKGKPLSVDPDEPGHIAEVVKALELKHVVITSVTRDDLKDGGATQFARTVEQIHRLSPESTVETLIPDFGGVESSLKIVMDSRLDILNHNVETVPRLYSQIRPEADFEVSLGVLKLAKRMDPNIITKSGMMVGLGEKFEEIQAVCACLADAGCDALTIGQYLSPTKSSIPVVAYIEPETFSKYQEAALQAGIPWVHAGPFVRSSYNAERLMRRIRETHCEQSI